MSSHDAIQPDTYQAEDTKMVIAPDRPEQRLDCLEVWGGSTGIDSGVCVTGLEVRVFSQPADDVAGGDLYLVSMCACAEVSRFLVADVTGHDAEAADVALRLRKLMRKHINKPDQTRLARSLNRDFDGMSRHGKFATAILATFFPPSQHLIICNAGHPSPLRYQAATQRWALLDPEKDSGVDDEIHNLPLGISEDSPYRQFAVPLQREDLVMVYTDGLTEARTANGELLGESGLLDAVRRIDVADTGRFLQSLRASLGALVGDSLRADDVTILLLKANGEQPPRQSITQKLRVTAKMFGLLPTSRVPA